MLRRVPPLEHGGLTYNKLGTKQQTPKAPKEADGHTVVARILYGARVLSILLG